MNNKVVYLAFIVMGIFSSVGMLVTMNLAHEYSHKSDFKSIATNDSLCLLEIPQKFEFSNILTEKIASYTFTPLNMTEYRKVEQYTEIKAYSFSIVIGIIFIVALVIILSNFKRQPSI